jgi:hypothetical protein
MEDMTMRYLTPALLGAALLSSTLSVLACDGLGENMHMGSIVSIDRGGNTFVILDAQSQKPIRFTASREALAPFAVDDKVEVTYEKATGDELHSVNLVHL